VKEVDINDNRKLRQKRSLRLIMTLAVISLLAGASVSASVDEFLEPRYVENNPYAGVVDDAVGDATWDELDDDGKGIKNLLKSFMKNRMDVSDEDRQTHIMKRVEADNVLKTALQFCLDNLDCSAESEVLSKILLSLDSRIPLMKGQIKFQMTQEDCETKSGTWTSVPDLVSDPDRGEDFYYCAWSDDLRSEELEEMKSERTNMEKNDMDFKPSKIMPKIAHKNWDSMEKNDIWEKMTMAMNSAIAISYCIDNQDCGGLDMTHDARHDLNSILTKIGEEMANRHADYEECHEELDCEREAKDGQQRKGMKGLITRVKDVFENEETLKRNHVLGDYDREDFTRFQMTQEDCETKSGTWTSVPDLASDPDRGEDFYYCAWSDDLRSEE